MLADLGQLFGGLGLLFVGIWLLTDNLKLLAARRIRLVALNWLPNRIAAYGWGVLFGSALQNMSALMFITAGISRANLITRERAFALLLGAKIGNGLLLLFVSLDVQTAAFFALGASGVAQIFVRKDMRHRVVVAVFGGALLIVSIGLLQAAAGSLAERGLLDEFLRLMEGSLWLFFLGGILLSLVFFSGVVAFLLALGLASTGLFNEDQLLMYAYGTFVGPTLLAVLLSWRLTYVTRQLAMFNVLYNIVLVSVLIPLLYVENWTGIPLMKALILALPLEPPFYTLFLIVDIAAALPFILVLPLLVQPFSRLWPPTREENLSQAVYIQDRGYGDADTALELANLEQRRVISALPSYLDAVRQGSEVGSLSSAVRQLSGDINEFLTDVRQNFPSRRYIEDINTALTCQRIIEWLEERFSELCEDLNNLPNEGSAGQLRDSLTEGIDTVVLAVVDGLTSPDPEQWSMVLDLTGDRTEMLRRIRSSDLPDETDLSDEGRAALLQATNTAAEIFSLLHRLTKQMQPSTASASMLGRNDNF